MLLQTNSYIVPREKRAAHQHLMQRFRQVLMRLGCDHFEVYEQVGANWTGGETSGRFVQMMKFRDRKHCQAVQSVERNDPAAQALVREFCELINFPYQQQQGLFAHGYYHAVIEPIRIKPSDLAYHAYNGDVSFQTPDESYTVEGQSPSDNPDPSSPDSEQKSVDAFSPEISTEKESSSASSETPQSSEKSG